MKVASLAKELPRHLPAPLLTNVTSNAATLDLQCFEVARKLQAYP